MGSFKGHVLPGSLFLIVGAWHIWAALVRYVSDPRSFRVRAWNGVSGFGGKLWHLELYVVAIGAFIDMCIEFFYSPHLKIFVGSEKILNPAHMNDFEHAGMLLMFFLYGLVALLSEKTNFLPLPEGTLCLVGAAAFTSEYLLFYFHSTAHTGLEGYYHLLLVILVGLCVLTSVAGALFPSSFPVDLASGISITLQGLWFYQTAFTLYGSMMPTGCKLEGNSIVCHDKESQIRGEFLANFQFFGLIVLTFLYVLVCYAVAAVKYGHQDLRKIHASEFDAVCGIEDEDRIESYIPS
ncbi:hypothetical protein LUZ61_012572 [Rhynchospora tenuis]|uniref:Transmembrane protein 45B n=1 Tax=Rhynchospora tenuis TaxID=198213 RepID=A0AAD6F197_9POAL|nr:hypothetical protein LUZ61_012572 [Rhynchospora tenuis]